jgi:hypothetical protein
MDNGIPASRCSHSLNAKQYGEKNAQPELQSQHDPVPPPAIRDPAGSACCPRGPLTARLTLRPADAVYCSAATAEPAAGAVAALHAAVVPAVVAGAVTSGVPWRARKGSARLTGGARTAGPAEDGIVASAAGAWPARSAVGHVLEAWHADGQPREHTEGRSGTSPQEGPPVSVPCQPRSYLFGDVSHVRATSVDSSLAVAISRACSAAQRSPPSPLIMDFARTSPARPTATAKGSVETR